MELDDVVINNLLVSIITAATISIAVGISLIIYIVTNFNNKRENLRTEIKALNSKLDSFIEFIYFVSNSISWKNRNIIKAYKSAINKGDSKEKEILLKENEFLYLFKSFKFLSDQYSTDSDSDKILTYSEISNYKIHTNSIWHKIDCRTGFKPEIDSTDLENMTSFELERMKKLIYKFDPERIVDSLDIDLVASIAGEVEYSTLDPLIDLIWKFEIPLDSLVSKLFIVMCVTTIFGVIVPLFLFLFPTPYIYCFAFALVCLMSISFISLLVLTYFYIRSVGKTKK